jgi:hypothetical protein
MKFCTYSVSLSLRNGPCIKKSSNYSVSPLRLRNGPYIKFSTKSVSLRIRNGPYIKFCTYSVFLRLRNWLYIFCTYSVSSKEWVLYKVLYLQRVPEAREGGFINVDKVLEIAASCYMLLDEVLLVLVRLDVRSEGKTYLNV